MTQEEGPTDAEKEKSKLFLLCLSIGSQNRQKTALYDIVTQWG